MSTPLSSTDTESTAAKLHPRVVTSTASATANIESSTTVAAHTATPTASPYLYSTSVFPTRVANIFRGPNHFGTPLMLQSITTSP